jgi:hypothetical protein
MGRRSRVKLFILLGCLLCILLGSTVAAAETLQAPVGGKAIPLSEGRVACPGTTGDWAVETDGRAVRPPAGDDAIGRVVEARVAANAGACGSAATALTLVATGHAPTIDATTTTLFVDEARIELHGRGLRGAVVRWSVGDREGEDRCVQPTVEPSGEKCAVAVGRGLPADATAQDLHWLPAGSHTGADVVTFDAVGRRVTLDESLVRPGRVVVSALLPPDVGLDLAGGTVSRIPLSHPEAVVGADCGAVSCDVSGSVIVVGGLSSVAGSLPVRLRLAPRVVLRKGDGFDAAPVVQVPILPCAMSVASGDALRGVDGSRVVVRVDARCASEARSLRWFSAGRSVDVLASAEDGGATFVLLGVGRVEGDELVVTASRAGADTSIVGQARARTRGWSLPQATLSLDGGEPIDFVPTNRPATVRWAKTQGAGDLVLLPLEGVYDVKTHDGSVQVQGERGAGGFVALRFAWRVPTLPGALATSDLAVVSDAVQRPMHEASVPAPLTSEHAIVELYCGSGPTLQRILPGQAAHVPYDERDACRVVFHRERLTADAGAQHLQLDVEVARVDGEPRPEAHVSQSIVLRAADQPRTAWIKGVLGRFDRVTVHVSRAEDGQTTDTAREEPTVQFSIVFGTESFRLYATGAIPTGLFRVSDHLHSGILTLNFGAILRATWLDQAGHEGFLGLEAGILAEGVAGDQSPSGASLTQVATVTGVGLSVPIANRSLATETSINLHAWAEYEVSRAVGGQAGNPLGFVFGPSISIGNIGANL